MAVLAYQLQTAPAVPNATSAPFVLLLPPRPPVLTRELLTIRNVFGANQRAAYPTT